MSENWTQADQDRAVAARREISAEYQDARRHGPRWAAWIFDKLANAMLSIEREGRRMMRKPRP